MSKKVAMITGATDGIGKATARQLAARQYAIIVVGRNPKKAADVVKSIKEETGNPDVQHLIADFSSLQAVRKLAEAVLEQYGQLDVLINNAGVVTSTRQLSADGYELQLAVNHLAPFLLTNLLMDALHSARIINVSSVGHARGQINFDDLHFEREFLPRQAYYQTKLANVLFTYALARRLNGATANVLHPGIVKTALSANYMGNPVFRFFEGLISISPEKGAHASVYLATSPDVAGINGGYFVKQQQKDSAPFTYDEALQEQLWTISTQLVGL